MKAPEGVRACLWSYDLSELNLETDRELIVTQILNYGGWEEVQWLLKRYPQKTIASVLKNPRRGVWLPDVLNFWTRLWGIHLLPHRYRRALFSLYPQR